MNIKTIRIALLIDLIIVIIAVVGLMSFIEWRTDRLMEAMDQYEKCVVEEYGVSVYQFKSEQGYLPTCKIK